MDGGQADEISVLSLVRERKTTETRPKAARVESGKKSQFQLKREAERLKLQQESAEDDVVSQTGQSIAPLISAEDADDVWLDANGAPLSAFKKAALQRRGQGPPGGTARNPASSSSRASARASHQDTVPPSTSAPDDIESISRENEAKIAAMSPEQIQREVEELQDQIGSDLLQQFKQLAALKSKIASGHAQSSSAPASIQSTPSASTVAKKSVSFNLPEESDDPPNDASKSIVASDAEPTSELKFHEHANMSELNDIVVTQAGHLLLPDKVPLSEADATRPQSQAVEETYTIPMLLSLAQSSATAQRQLGLTILSRVAAASSAQLEIKLGAEQYIRRILRVAALASRYTLSAQHRNESTVARRCLLSILTYLSQGTHLRPTQHRTEASSTAEGSTLADTVSTTTTVAAPILSNSHGDGGLPEDLERDLAQARPNSSAASLLVSDLVHNGLVEALRNDLLWSDRILTTSRAVKTSSLTSTLSGNDDLAEAMEAVIETAIILNIIARSSDLHAEAIADEENSHIPDSGASKASKDTILQVLVKHGIRNRRWPPIDDELTLFNVSPEVLSLIGTICHSTPRAALKLTQQTSIANTFLRFVAIPPWSLDEPEESRQQDKTTTGLKSQDAIKAQRWSLANWYIFSGALKGYLGLSKHSLEGSLLDAWSLWLDISTWIQAASYLTFPSSLRVSSQNSLQVQIQTVQLEAVSRVLQLFGSWIERAVGSEGDFEDLTWTEVSSTKDVALGVLTALGSSRSQQVGTTTGAGQDDSSTATTAKDHIGEAGAAAADEKQAMHLQVFTSAVNLLLTWLQAANETARNPARETTRQLQLNTDLHLLFEAVLDDANRALKSFALSNSHKSEGSVSLGQAAFDAVAAIHEMARFLGLAPTSSPETSARNPGDVDSWHSLSSTAKQIMTRHKDVYSTSV
ncbi:hypothetical protein OC845_003213 [Tilletia horrida]|nr:hypothetical protein OC845_003213 [Tilletia horrida]